MKLVSRFVQGKKMKTINEYLLALEKSKWTYNYRPLFLSMHDRTRSNRNIRLTLSDFNACSLEIWTLLFLYQ